ncbi:MAG: hypothetical protein M1597_00710 [Candidatus Thermoplasmatota archaeon]|nr:hypothetical protein [Candidatus Thermoplasmatota archaeon]
MHRKAHQIGIFITRKCVEQGKLEIYSRSSQSGSSSDVFIPLLIVSGLITSILSS